MIQERQKRIRIIHFVLDDKFFYPVKAHFDNDSRLVNQYIVINRNIGENLNYIKSQDAICLATEKDAQRFVRSSEYDILFFHSLPVKSWRIALEAPKDKRVVWWTWGYDIYTPAFGISPFLHIELLKPKTKQLYLHRHHFILNIIKVVGDFFQSIPYRFVKKRLLKRIDFFMPVVSSEYQMINRLPYTHAEEFYYKDSLEPPVEMHKKRKNDGDILCGNSATYTNNHLDLVPFLNRGNLNGRTIHIPLSYGVKTYSKTLTRLFKVNGANTEFMMELVPIKQYFQILDNCSYFICGSIRQQAMGNVYYCLNNHIKVFLYRDSLIYKFLKEAGYVVFAIEEIDSNSFATTLTEEEMGQNIEAYRKDFERRNKIYEETICKLQKVLSCN